MIDKRKNGVHNSNDSSIHEKENCKKKHFFYPTFLNMKGETPSFI